MAVAIDTALDVSAYTIPTDEPESDGTLEWSSTTIVVVEARADGETGLGYTYTDAAAVRLIEHTLAEAIRGVDPLDVGAAWEAMSSALRNIGRSGLAWMALSAVDAALWDLKARVLGQPLVTVLGAARAGVPVYGSGGFTSYSLERLSSQLAGWVEQGIPRVKMKVGRDPEADTGRLDEARAAIGADAELFVDANGAFGRKEALAWAERYAHDWHVAWFEEPVSSEDVDGLRFLRERAPAGLEIAAGEYGDTLPAFRRLASAVDCLQADVTRCGGYTGLQQVAALADACHLDLSGHCAPQLSVHGLAAVRRLRHLEYFHDHVRVESLIFDGVLEPEDGVLTPDRTRPGNGLSLRRAEAERWAL
jgi:L-alanine-DL-glutamate epimerase-like enolase superfamily enzyme